jgi:transposase-like protein
MEKQRRPYTPAFKLKVVLESLQRDYTTTRLQESLGSRLPNQYAQEQQLARVHSLTLFYGLVNRVLDK